MDVLSEMLSVSSVRGSAGARITAAGEWGVEWAGDRDAVVYAVTAGIAYLIVDGDTPRMLMPGDVVVLAQGSGHTLASAPSAPVHSCDNAAAVDARLRGAALALGDGGARTHILGASYSYDFAAPVPVFAVLPPVLHLSAPQLDASASDIVTILGRELAAPGPATDLLLDRLVDVLLVEVMRAWLSTDTELSASWWGVLRDPLLYSAVSKIHEEPGRPWTTESLAREVSTSKQTLMRRFAVFTGTTPGKYMTDWRMNLAARRLRDTDDSLDTIATDLGYASEFAFSRAFRRERQIPPGRYRSRSRDVGSRSRTRPSSTAEPAPSIAPTSDT
ncbi:AraC family transcriptional regulator [Rhodococcoides fascians]|uniref:AraC family transcriptional regulator n=1 Tax=Rhodococcoides fascians TaxID=1828 RepID=UPI0005623C9D|nr:MULTISPECIES: AraC family transcriptional regulator [Rhodococcus]OZC56754.1 AraC family transcriptional regulator [Rhodococcus sp. 06-621-2]OZE79425.1 AraC family transcriptional regulator [Rhodococcus sp. 15-649-1-2]